MSVGMSSAYNRPRKCCGRGRWSTLHPTRCVPLSLRTLGRGGCTGKTEKERASFAPLPGLHLTSVLHSEGKSMPGLARGPDVPLRDHLFQEDCWFPTA